MLILPTVYSYDNVAQIYDSTYSQNGNNILINMSMDSQSFIQSNFTHSTSTNNHRLYVNETSMYKVSYSCVWNATGGSNLRRIYENYISINGTTKVTPSESDVYIRGDDSGTQAGGHTSSTSATLLVNLSKGSYIQLMGGEDTSDVNNGNTFSRDGCYLLAQKLNTRAIEVYDSIGGLNVQTNQVVNLDSTYYNGDTSLYSLNNDQVNVSEDGLYRLSYTSCVRQNTGANRQSPQSWVRKNGNENISLSFSFAGYTRGSTNDRNKNCNRANTLINLSSGDYLELQTGIFDSESTVQEVLTNANQGWLLLEKIEMDSSIISINNSGQQIDHGITAALNFDLNDKLGTYVSHTGSTSKIQFKKSGLYEIAYNIGYQDYAGGERIITCGELRKNSAVILKPSRQCIYTRADAQARTGTVSSTSLINVSRDDFIEILIDVEGESEGSDGESIQILKGSTWVTITKINETVSTNFKNSTLFIGNTSLNTGNISRVSELKLFGEGSTNVNVLCDSGDCSRFSHNFTNGGNFTGIVEDIIIEFTCDDSNVGSFSAIYNVTSNEDQISSQMNVSCNVLQTYGILRAELNSPFADSTSIIFQNTTFNVSGSIFCDGVQGSICGSVNSYVRYNTTTSLFENISRTLGITPFWTTSFQPQTCVLNEGQNCSVFWLVNASGLINSLHTINLNVSSNLTQVLGNSSKNTTINISILPLGQVLWASSSLNLGSVDLSLGNAIGSADLIPSGNHTNVIISCTSGDCGNITTDFIDGINLSDTIDYTVTFTCNDSVVGSYSTIFEVTSNEDLTPNTISVSCEVKQTYGQFILDLLYPEIPPMLTKVKKNVLFTLNASILCSGTPGSSCENVTSTPRYGEYSLDLGDESDGGLTVIAPNTIINDYSYFSSSETSGATTVTLNDATSFFPDDDILIIQMQKSGGLGVVGRYEYSTILSKLGNDITLSAPLSQDYGSGLFDQIGATVTQIVRIPQYSDVTINSGASITAPGWNGYFGGIVIFRATGTLNTTGFINVSGKGFRGGDCNGCGNNAWGDQGEGETGLGSLSTGSNGVGGGGGNGPGSSGEAGGGGGYGTSGTGGSSESSSSGGSSIGLTDLSTLYFGGGAGAGGDNNGRTPFPEHVNGGGIVVVYSNEILNANIEANGDVGIYGSSGVSGGVSGSGAGGTIWLNSIYLDISNVNALGGPFVGGYLSDIGGAGGDGRIRLDYISKLGDTNPTPGFTNTSFSFLMQLITNTSNSNPFQILGSQSQTCDLLYAGDVCLLSWDINTTGTIGLTYDLDINGTSSQVQVLDNDSLNSVVIIDGNPRITIHSPQNNSVYFKGEDLYANLSSDDPLTYVGYYLNSNISNIVDLTNISDTSWNTLIQNLSSGYYNITFVYNTSLNNFTSNTHYFSLINQTSHIKINKSITSLFGDMYLVKLIIENRLNETKNVSLIDFVEFSFTYGSFNYLNNWTNLTTGKFNGDILGWDLTLSPYEKREINYSILGNTNSTLMDNFMLSVE